MNTFTIVAQQTNLPTLLNLHLGWSLIGALSSCPVYNVPVFFFGIWAYHNHESNAPIKTFTGVLALTIILDVVWFILHGSELTTSNNEVIIPHPRGFRFCMVMNIASLIIKPITVFSSISTLQARGESLGSGGDWSEAPGAFPGAYQTVRDGDGEF